MSKRQQSNDDQVRGGIGEDGAVTTFDVELRGDTADVRILSAFVRAKWGEFL